MADETKAIKDTTAEESSVKDAGDAVEDTQVETIEETPSVDGGKPDVWGEAFSGKTPEDVQAQLDARQDAARKWQKRAEDNAAELAELKKTINEPDARIGELEGLLNESEREALMFRDLIALQVEYDTPVDFAMLADSRMFADAYARLDRESDGFSDQLKKLVEKRQPTQVQQVAATRRFETGAGQSSQGEELYNRLFKK